MKVRSSLIALSLIASAAAILIVVSSLSVLALDERPVPPGTRPGKPPFASLPSKA